MAIAIYIIAFMGNSENSITYTTFSRMFWQGRYCHHCWIREGYGGCVQGAGSVYPLGICCDTESSTNMVTDTACSLWIWLSIRKPRGYASLTWKTIPFVLSHFFWSNTIAPWMNSYLASITHDNITFSHSTNCTDLIWEKRMTDLRKKWNHPLEFHHQSHQI